MKGRPKTRRSWQIKVAKKTKKNTAKRYVGAAEETTTPMSSGLGVTSARDGSTENV